jgi:parvulin-like peptidyl-prolyl isomerase
MQKYLFILILTSCFVFSLGFAPDVSAQAKDAVVASVNGKKITVDEFNKKFNAVKSQTINPPTKQQFLEDLVRYEVGLQEAQKKKLNQDPTVQDRMQQELYKSLLEKELADKVQKISVTEKELQDFYKKNPEIRSSHILIELKQGATPEQRAEAKKRAEEILSEVKSSKRPFEELVKLYSDDTLSKTYGGDIGFQTRLTLVPNYYDTILGMKVNDVKGLIETLYGFHIVKVTGRRNFENADRKQIRMSLFNEKRKDVFNEYFDKLKKSYQIETNQKLLQ